MSSPSLVAPRRDGPTSGPTPVVPWGDGPISSLTPTVPAGDGLTSGLASRGFPGGDVPPGHASPAQRVPPPGCGRRGCRVPRPASAPHHPAATPCRRCPSSPSSTRATTSSMVSGSGQDPPRGGTQANLSRAPSSPRPSADPAGFLPAGGRGHPRPHQGGRALPAPQPAAGGLRLGRPQPPRPRPVARRLRRHRGAPPAQVSAGRAGRRGDTPHGWGPDHVSVPAGWWG